MATIVSDGKVLLWRYADGTINLLLDPDGNPIPVWMVSNEPGDPKPNHENEDPVIPTKDGAQHLPPDMLRCSSNGVLDVFNGADFDNGKEPDKNKLDKVINPLGATGVTEESAEESSEGEEVYASPNGGSPPLVPPMPEWRPQNPMLFLIRYAEKGEPCLSRLDDESCWLIECAMLDKLWQYIWTRPDERRGKLPHIDEVLHTPNSTGVMIPMERRNGELFRIREVAEHYWPDLEDVDEEWY